MYKIYNNLKKIREEKGMSLRTISEKTGFSYQTISNYERQLSNRPEPEKILKISEVLKVSPFELLGLSFFKYGDIEPKTQNDIDILKKFLNILELEINKNN